MLANAAQAVRGIEPRGLSRPELVDLLRVLDRIESAATEQRLAVLREIDALNDQGLPAAALSRSVSHRSERVASREADTAERLGEMPAVAQALSAGDITIEHAHTIARAAERTSTRAAEAGLLDQAKRAPADLFARRASSWASSHESPTTAGDRHARQRADRELVSWHEGGDEEHGALHVHGQMDHSTAQAFRVALQEKIDELWRADGGRDGSPNEVRTPAQRAIDALVQLVLRGREGGEIHPRFMIHVVVNVDAGTAHYLDGSPVPAEVLEALGGDALVVGHLFDGKGQPLWLGRSRRLATDAQWLSRIVTDRGCTDCGAGPERCEMHHVDPWEPIGPSDIDNFELKCRTDHGLQHRGSRGDPKTRPGGGLTASWPTVPTMTTLGVEAPIDDFRSEPREPS